MDLSAYTTVSVSTAISRSAPGYIPTASRPAFHRLLEGASSALVSGMPRPRHSAGTSPAWPESGTPEGPPRAPAHTTSYGSVPTSLRRPLYACSPLALSALGPRSHLHLIVRLCVLPFDNVLRRKVVYSVQTVHVKSLR